MAKFSEVLWSELDSQFRLKAEEEKGLGVYLPNLAPSGPVEHVLIAMEPSLGAWAHGKTRDCGWRTPRVRLATAFGISRFL